MYQRILVVITDRPGSQVAVEHSIGLAQAHGADLFFVSVLSQPVGTVAEIAPVPPIATIQDVERELRRRADALLGEAQVRAAQAGVRSQALCTPSADAVRFVATVAGEQGCDLVVVAAEPRNAVMRLLTGSLVPGLITQVPVPVLVCHEPPAPDLRARD